MKVIVNNGKWRRWIFEPSDRKRALDFAKRFGLEAKEVDEVPYSPGYTVWVGKEDTSYTNPVGYYQGRYDESQLFV